jgi:dienelactone hydrolase
MARITFPCPECRAPVSLSRAIESGEIKCPECGAWVAIPPNLRESEDGGRISSSDEGGSKAAIWIGLAIGGGVLLFLLVCGGIGTFLWFLRGNPRPTRTMNPPAVKSATPAQVTFAPATAFPPQTEDYAEARKKFKTTLTQETPAPQRGSPLQPPPDVTELTYASGDLRLIAWVSRDPGDGQKKKPAVLFLHGGFAFDFQDWQQAKPFRDAGYVVMIPMLRGENGQPGVYSMFYNEVDDVLAAADALAKLNYVDDKRIYVAGHSAGGTLALLAAMTSTRFRAAASFSGSTDQFSWASNQQNLVPFDPGGFLEFAERTPAAQEEFQMRSPLAFAGSFKCPVRMYFGNQEPLFRSSTQLTATLAKQKNLDVEAVEVPGDHMSAVTPAMRQCIEFFEKNKGPRAKQAQEPLTK